MGSGSTSISLGDFYKSYASTEGSNLDGGTVWNGKSDPITTGATTTSGNTTTTTSTSTAPSAVTGDINKDGKVTSADMVQLAKYLLREKTDSGMDFKAGDVNGDGVLNGLDLVLYKQFLAGTITNFPK